MSDLKSLEESLYSLSEKVRTEIEKTLLSGKPFSYIHREAEFYHHRFYVDERVLIPRPETEHLVDMIVETKRKFHSILDVGTGSGVILLSLLKARVAETGTGSDISERALEVTKINANRLRMKPKLIQSDRFENIPGSFDLIVSNPPYIKPVAHRDGVQKTVDSFEPHLALYVNDGEYESWFRKFFNEVRTHLNPGGEFWMEGHEKELQGQSRLLLELGFRSARVIKDYSGLDRFLHASIV